MGKVVELCHHCNQRIEESDEIVVIARETKAVERVVAHFGCAQKNRARPSVQIVNIKRDRGF